MQILWHVPISDFTMFFTLISSKRTQKGPKWMLTSIRLTTLFSNQTYLQSFPPYLKYTCVCSPKFFFFIFRHRIYDSHIVIIFGSFPFLFLNVLKFPMYILYSIYFFSLKVLMITFFIFCSLVFFLWAYPWFRTYHVLHDQSKRTYNSNFSSNFSLSSHGQRLSRHYGVLTVLR